MSNVKAQMSNQILSSKFKKFWILNFEIHLTLRFWNLGLDDTKRGCLLNTPILWIPRCICLMFWHSLIAFWDYLFDFLPLLSHSPPWLWWSRFSMIVWSTTSPQIKHRQLKKGPFEPKNSSWIIIPLHRSHFTLSSPKLSLWDHGDWNKVNAVFYWKRLLYLRAKLQVKHLYPPKSVMKVG